MAEVPILVSTRMGGRAVYCGGIKSDGSRWRGEFSCNEEAALSRLQNLPRQSRTDSEEQSRRAERDQGGS